MFFVGLQTHFNAPLGDDACRQVRGFGFTLARIDAQGADVQTMLAMVDEVRRAGLTPLVIVDDVKQVAALEPGTLAEWTNELDGDVSPADYRRTLDAACFAARASGVLLVAPCFSNTDDDSMRWANQVRDAGGGWPDGMHAVSFHRYGPSSNVLEPHPAFASRENEVKWVRALCAGLPFIVTEFGWDTAVLTDEEAAERDRWEWAFWSSFEDCIGAVRYQRLDGEKSDEKYGILRVDGTEKAAIVAAVPAPPADQPPAPPTEHREKVDMKIALKADNGKYLCAERGGDDNIIVANRDAVGPWETFGVKRLSSGKIALRAHNGRWLCAELGGGAELSCNREAIEAWEKFTVHGSLTHGSSVALQSDNGRFVCAEVLTDSKIVNVTREARGAWETFTVEVVEAAAVAPRTGVPQPAGQAIIDANGQLRPLGVTLFWALYGWKFERDKLVATLDWLAARGVNALRILGEVDWPGRSIEPSWPDYEQVAGEFVDAAYDRGFRVMVTLVGGRPSKEHPFDYLDLAKKWVRIAQSGPGREHKILDYEVANEAHRLDKIDVPSMVAVATYLRQNTPNLVALTAPRSSAEEHGGASMKAMMELTKDAGATMFSLHTRRAGHDNGWADVRQSYDFASQPFVGCHREPPGLQSSVGTCEHPLLLAVMRMLGIVCGAPSYVLHVGQGVTGRADAKYGRPEHMWDVPGIEEVLAAVRRVDALLPEYVENWTVVNNGRSTHPLPLDPRVGVGFWEGSKPGAVNKNYAAIAGDKFVVVLAGVKADKDDAPTVIGKARRKCAVEAINPMTGAVVDSRTLDAGEEWALPGRKDTMAAYLVVGRYV